MQVSIINATNLKDLSGELLRPDGKMKLKYASHYSQYSWDDFRSFCHFHARYGIPTIELIHYLDEIIGGRSAIEIGSGCGDLGFHLGIKMTDSKLQEDPLIVKIYKAMKQPVIKYPQDVEKIDALDAVKKYQPQVVVASWITPYSSHEANFGSNPFGVKESEILDLVETFIIIGNLDTHWDKPIRKKDHLLLHPEWLVSRAKNPKNNCIMVWNNK